MTASTTSPGNDYLRQRMEQNVTTLMKRIWHPERHFCLAAIVYGIAISLLTLAVPLSVQMLINTVANTALPRFILILVGLLLTLLLLSAFMKAMQLYVMELFERHFFARVTAEIAYTSTHARFSYFESVNRPELMNRFFEIMHVQKIMPTLIFGGVALILQIAVGVVLVSFYHPLLFLFMLLFGGACFLAWKIWHRRALEASFLLSSAKYKAAGWMGDLARANAFFKSAKRITRALEKTNDISLYYLQQRRRFFRYSFSQTLAFLGIYVLFSTLLLGLGGWLVIQGQLTLGQLVAAELILSAIFGGIARFGYYLVLYYELAAAAEKINELLSLPQEDVVGSDIPQDTPLGMSFVDASLTYQSERYQFSFTLQAAGSVLAYTTSHTQQKLLIDLLLRRRDIEQGEVTLQGKPLENYHPHLLRDRVAVVDNTVLLGGTIASYFTMVDATLTQSQMMHYLGCADMGDAISRLPNGLETLITPSGYPLSHSEQLRLKLALALASHPRLLVLTQIFDALPYHQREVLCRRLCQDGQFTLLYFSNRTDVRSFKEYLFITPQQQRYVEDIEALHRCEADYRQEVRP